MKAVLLSIRPNWCKKIFNGEKTIEVRKSRPKLEPPFEVLVYCTTVKNMPLADYVEIHLATGGRIDEWSGKVIGEFICNKVDVYRFSNYEAQYDVTHDEMSQMCLNHPELIAYGKGKPLYGWHITEPKLSDRPRELSEFGIARAPQSWYYVEEV